MAAPPGPGNPCFSIYRLAFPDTSCPRPDIPYRPVNRADDGQEQSASLATVAREWTRIGVIGFGGPPAHIALLRRLVVDRRAGWTRAPSRTRSPPATCCRGRRRPSSRSSAPAASAGWPGAIVGGARVHPPGARHDPRPLASLFLADVAAAAGCAAPGAGARRRRGRRRGARGAATWSGRASAARRGTAARSAAGSSMSSPGRGARAGRARSWCSSCSAAARSSCWSARSAADAPLARRAARPLAARGGLGALAWTAFKVGALSFGGGFVIIPLMQGDAVHATTG